jgi:hypothetical protein
MAGTGAQSEEHERTEETAAELIARAKAAGYEVTIDQLTRWHRRDLLPKPRQVSLGRKGSELRFPAGTSDQLLELLHLKGIYRSLDKVGWGLWWGGWRVPTALARAYIEGVLTKMSKFFSEFVTPDGELTDKAKDLLDRAPDAYLEAGALRRARRRVGVDRFDWFMESILLVGTGHTDLVKDEDLDLLERGMALDRARSDPIASTGSPWLSSDKRLDFENIGQLNDTGHQLELLNAASDEALCGARDMAKAVMAVVSNVGGVIDHTAGPSAFGFGAFGRLFTEMGDDPAGQAFIVPVVLSVVDAGFEQGVRDVASGEAESKRLVARHEILLALRLAVPELTPPK